MSEPFGPAYADAYDLLYHDKDYPAECSALEAAFRAHGAGTVRSVLELGCGTGGHGLELAARGYEVVGVDRSAEMLARARAKAAARGVALTLTHGDLRDCDLGRTFDAALMMFAVLGYQLGNADVIAALRAARRHLAPGGLLAFDVWYGPAVLTQRPGERVREVPGPDGMLRRAARSTLDLDAQVCTVHYHLQRVAEGRVVAEADEEHRVRFFFPQELRLLLAAGRFELSRLGAFPEFAAEASEATWNVFVIARAVP